MNNVNLAGYADDNTPHVIGDGVMQDLESLKEAPDKQFCWFANNQMKANPEKCHLITSVGTKIGTSCEIMPILIYHW